MEHHASRNMVIYCSTLLYFVSKAFRKPLTVFYVLIIFKIFLNTYKFTILFPVTQGLSQTIPTGMPSSPRFTDILLFLSLIYTYINVLYTSIEIKEKNLL